MLPISQHREPINIFNKQISMMGELPVVVGQVGKMALLLGGLPATCYLLPVGKRAPFLFTWRLTAAQGAQAMFLYFFTRK
jgi:hypothetical protein